MSLLCHIILFFYSIIGIGLSVAACGLYFRLLPDAYIWNEVLYLSSRWETLLGIGVFLLVSLYLLVQSLSSKTKDMPSREALIVHGELGEVQISLDVLKDMANKIAWSIPGVRDVKVKVRVSKNDKSKYIPSYDLRLTVGEKENIINISDGIKRDLEDYMVKYIGVEGSIVKITVTTISNAQVNGKKRVV